MGDAMARPAPARTDDISWPISSDHRAKHQCMQPGWGSRWFDMIGSTAQAHKTSPSSKRKSQSVWPAPTGESDQIKQACALQLARQLWQLSYTPTNPCVVVKALRSKSALALCMGHRSLGRQSA